MSRIFDAVVIVGIVALVILVLSCGHIEHFGRFAHLHFYR
jgi:hypothetical protein